MTTNSEHVPFDTLNDLVDGTLSEAESSAAREHMASCGECSMEYDDLRDLLSTVGSLPKSVLPPDNVWSDIKSTLNERKEIVLPLPPRLPGSAPWLDRGFLGQRRSTVWLAAAAVILVVVSSTVTRVLINGDGSNNGSTATERVAGNRPPAMLPTVLPASVRRTENEYSPTIDQLKALMDSDRGRLNPETVRTVDRSLAVIDSAIAEARSALIADPNNGMLVDLLSSSYQRKLDLLRRTSELSSKT